MQSDSWADAAAGDSATSSSALPSPDRHGCSSWVSFEFRKGTCDWRRAMAAKTSARALSDLLMACVCVGA